MAVHLIKHYWNSGILRGSLLARTLEELGYIDDTDSHRSRREFLTLAIGDPDPDVRYAAVLGLTYLEDRSTLPSLFAALATENNDLVAAHISEAMVQMGEPT